MTFGVDWNWFDLIVMAALGFGFYRGRKRGMSVELLSVLQVLIMVVVGALIYKPVGDKFAQMIDFSLELWLCYFLVYALFATFVHLLFNYIKGAVGEKLVGSDLFGSMEYYFGMAAGLLRYVGVVIMTLAMLNAKIINRAAIAAEKKAMQENFGNISFPTFGSIQIDVLEGSYTGKSARRYLETLLIEPTASHPPTRKERETIGQKKERALEEAIGGKK